MFGSSEMVIVLVIVLVLFGGSQLPKLAKNLGKAQKEFKDGMGEAERQGPDRCRGIPGGSHTASRPGRHAGRPAAAAAGRLIGRLRRSD